MHYIPDFTNPHMSADTGYTLLMYNNDCVLTSLSIMVVLHSPHSVLQKYSHPHELFCHVACDGPKQSSTHSGNFIKMSHSKELYKSSIM